MKDVLPSRAPIRFGVFELDPASGELRKQGLKVKLQDQPSQILRILLEHPGKVVTRGELRQRIWPSDTFVDFDQGLYNAAKKLREALGDSAETPRYIETLSRRGYRFIETVNGGSIAESPAEDVPSQAPTADIRAPRRLGIGIWLVAVTVLLLVALMALAPATFWQRFSGKSTAAQIRSLAVLPLQNLSTDPAQEYFSDGMTDALITDLAQMRAVKVISRTSVMHYKKTDKTLPEIARELNVDGFVEGTVQRSGDRVRITAQLIHGPSDKHLWASSYERDLRDIFALEQEVTQDIADQVRARITPENRSIPVQPRPVNVEALEAYLQGNFHLRMSAGRRNEELRKAGNYFEHAIDADPTFVPAYLGMAEAHHNLFWPSNEDFAIMRASAEKALALAPTSSDVHRAVGLVKFEEWDWAGAEEEYRRAIELNPNNANAHDFLAATLDVMGRMDEGWKEYEIAQDLDPGQDHLSWALFRRGDYDRAIALAQRVAESRPEDAVIRWQLSESYARKGLYRDWVQRWSEALTLAGFPEAVARVRQAFAKSGYQGAMRQVAEETERWMSRKQGYVPGVLAEVYTILGDKDRAFYWLRQGCEHHYQAISDPLLQWTKIDPGFAPLRSDPRFGDVLHCMGLPRLPQ